MKLKQLLSHVRGSEPTDSLESRHIPLIVTPLENEPHEHSRKLTSRDDSPGNDVENEPRFKSHHEASAIELFYDLFFVANLATFTVNHEITSPATFRSYLGFFSLLWATWLQTTLFDVRFAYDSVFLRICKALHFGVQMGFVLSGAVYSTDPDSVDAAAFQTLAIVQMISRVTLVIQYASVLWYIKGYPRTRIPLLLIMAVLFAAGMIYLGTYWGFDPATSKTYYAWYITAPIEVVLCIIISSIWRVLSFKQTHLVERVGLLTLIVIGEGILGLSKSVSYLLQSSTNVSARNAGVLIASVLLIYFIWMLYFDQIQNNRFGTIKQQVWAILHYPLHLCILFTVEGSTNLFTWESVIPNQVYWWSMLPTVREGVAYTDIWPDQESLLGYVEGAVKNLSTHFDKEKQIYKYYDYRLNITALENIEFPYGSRAYQEDASIYLTDMWQGVSNAVFQIFGVLVPESPAYSADTTASKEYNDFQSLLGIFDVVFFYFYIAAGLFLVTLAILYAVGNKRKTAGEWFTIGFRVFAGAGITMTLVGILYNPNMRVMANYLVGPWHVIVVMLVYLLVIVVDNVVVECALNRRRRKGIDTEKQTPNHGPIRRATTQIYSYSRARNSEEDLSYRGNERV